MRAAFLTMLIIFARQTFAQDVGFDKVDNYVESLQFDRNISMDTIVSALTNPFTSATLKTRAIYYWIANNIEYDYGGYQTDYWKTYPSDQALMMDTYKLRKGICSGYSHLFKYMLNKVKIDCEVVDGYARFDLQTVIIEKTNHAWNVAKLNDKWYLFDVTWGSDTLRNKVDGFWFKTPPSVFVLSHYPENANWTLLNKNLSLTVFKSSPVYTRCFIAMSIAAEFSEKGYYYAVDNSVTIDLKTTKEYVWLPKLYDVGKRDWFSPTKIEDSAFEKGHINLTIDRKGKFILRLNALENGEFSATIHEDLVYYVIENK